MDSTAGKGGLERVDSTTGGTRGQQHCWDRNAELVRGWRGGLDELGGEDDVNEEEGGDHNEFHSHGGAHHIYTHHVGGTGAPGTGAADTEEGNADAKETEAPGYLTGAPGKGMDEETPEPTLHADGLDNEIPTGVGGFCLALARGYVSVDSASVASYMLSDRATKRGYNCWWTRNDVRWRRSSAT